MADDPNKLLDSARNASLFLAGQTGQPAGSPGAAAGQPAGSPASAGQIAAPLSSGTYARAAGSAGYDPEKDLAGTRAAFAQRAVDLMKIQKPGGQASNEEPLMAAFRASGYKDPVQWLRDQGHEGHVGYDPASQSFFNPRAQQPTGADALLQRASSGLAAITGAGGAPKAPGTLFNGPTPNANWRSFFGPLQTQESSIDLVRTAQQNQASRAAGLAAELAKPGTFYSAAAAPYTPTPHASAGKPASGPSPIDRFKPGYVNPNPDARTQAFNNLQKDTANLPASQRNAINKKVVDSYGR